MEKTKEKTIGEMLVETGRPCFGQYYRNGNCTETEKPSGRMHPCPVEHGEECYIKEIK